MKLDWVTGAVVVFALCLAALALLTLGVLDVARQYRGGDLPKPPTASSWIKRWAYARPVVPFLAGLVLGILAGHFGWFQPPVCP